MTSTGKLDAGCISIKPVAGVYMGRWGRCMKLVFTIKKGRWYRPHRSRGPPVSKNDTLGDGDDRLADERNRKNVGDWAIVL
jgi:hypothetical protein